MACGARASELRTHRFIDKDFVGVGFEKHQDAAANGDAFVYPAVINVAMVAISGHRDIYDREMEARFAVFAHVFIGSADFDDYAAGAVGCMYGRAGAHQGCDVGRTG